MTARILDEKLKAINTVAWIQYAYAFFARMPINYTSGPSTSFYKLKKEK